MASSPRTLSMIHMLHSLGSFLWRRFKSLGFKLLFALCRKLASTAISRCLWYCGNPAVSRKTKSAHSSCTIKCTTLDPSLDLRGHAAAASSVPTSRQVSRAPIGFPADAGHSTPTPSVTSRQGYSALFPVPTFQSSGTVTPELGENIRLLDRRIDMPSPIPGLVDTGFPQEGLLEPPHLVPSHTNLVQHKTTFPITSGDILRYSRHSTISRDLMLEVIKPLTITFPHPQESVGLYGSFGAWTPATHPEGALYFYDKERRLFTDTDMRDKMLRDTSRGKGASQLIRGV
ncbi:hypothetical protein EI94DRAFT_1699331 [Lactarius quietus]|nr:hypothetical protein EI94DRAFT_1699331 [Lactarius quietus]